MRRRDFLTLPVLAAALPRFALADHLLSFTDRPQNWATPTEYFDRLITPTPVFFVRSHFGPPALRRDRRLAITGLVKTPLELTVADLAGFEEVTATAVLQCAGNGRALHEPRVPGVQWVHGAMGQATWTGVRLADVLARAGLADGAAHLRIAGADRPPRPTVPRYLRGIPLARALDPTTLVAFRMNGEPLTLAHGAPLRLVVPGWTGNHWVKWVTEIRVQKEEAEGFYMQTAYRWPKKPGEPGQPVPPADTVPVATFPVRSIIARPGDGATTRPGRQEVVGAAFSGEAAIARVELSRDGGKSWAAAALEGDPGAGRWQVFRFAFDAGPGRHEVMARATDARGAVQPERAVWNPSGYLWNAWQRVAWTVAA